MSSEKSLKQWLLDHRNSTRMAYALQLASRAMMSVLSLFWIRLFVGAMGAELYSLNLAFQRVVTLGGLGDLGMGGAVGIRAGQHLGRGEEKELQRFLSSARSMFLVLALMAAGVFLLLSPWLPHWLGFHKVPGSGSLTLLFGVGALLAAGLVFSSYLGNLNYACGNVTWPVIPTFILLQVALFGQWSLARLHQPLWIQFLPGVATAATGLLLTRLYVRSSHPALAGIFPLRSDWRTAASLFESSFWIYLCCLGNAIYRSTDALVINAGSHFKAGTLTWYDSNYRLCDITVFLATSASFVSLPKITQWMSSSQEQDQLRVRLEMRRLNQFQTLLGCVAALGYLAGNSLFMGIWWRHKADVVPAAPLLLQMAFALNMAITAGGDTGLQMAIRCGSSGLRKVGLTVAVSSFLNLILSMVAMRVGWLAGIAFATVLAQTILTLVTGFITCRHMHVRWLPWTLRAWLFPVAAVSIAAWLRYALPYDSALNVLLVIGSYSAMLLGMAWSLGITPTIIKHELAILRKLF